jgi:type 1 glutamine amidotransferase
VAAGKPVVGLRTASHAFAAQPTGDGFAAWNNFDTEVLGGHSEGHYNNKPPGDPARVIGPVAANASHLVLTGVPATPFPVTSHLYKNRNLTPGTVTLLQGHVSGEDTLEPVAWVNNTQDRRVFYTSLGNPGDFQLPAFRRLLLNGILWCLHDPLPPASAGTGFPAK